MGKGIIRQNVKQTSFICLQTGADKALQNYSTNQSPTNHPIALSPT